MGSTSQGAARARSLQVYILYCQDMFMRIHLADEYIVSQVGIF